ncbi:MAG: hypothetical protein US98_C0028G0009 [Parcubacteria group bacterium GW2011_GWC1_38_6]|nr:MAG: hypothetical protein US98_C0028G0009 [Parcubacteria group bacterium GW2011_GWC1_38_6]
MDNSLKNLIDSASSILILLPTKAYLDQVAAGLSLYLTLKSSKDVAVSSPSQMTVEFSRLIGVDKISTELGNKNLVITFPNYQATNIERVSYDIEEGQFKLSVIPKAGMTVPTSEQTNISYAGVKADLIILVGGANESHFPAISTPDLKGVKIIHIGTRLLEVSSDAQIMSFARPGSSSSELVGNLIKENDLSIDADIATNLLAGIEDGSKNFQSPDVTADTFSMFAQLLNMGGQRIKKMTASSFPQGAIPTQPYNQQPKQVPQSQKLVEQILQGQEQPDKEPQPEEVPTSWSEPKIYTGTSVS